MRHVDEVSCALRRLCGPTDGHEPWPAHGLRTLPFSSTLFFSSAIKSMTSPLAGRSSSSREFRHDFRLTGTAFLDQRQQILMIGIPMFFRFPRRAHAFTSRRAISTSRGLTPTDLRLLEGTSRSSVSRNSLAYRSVFIGMMSLYGMRAATYCRVRITTLAMPILPVCFSVHATAIAFVSPLVGCEVVGRFVVHGSDLVLFHEAENIDGLSGFDIGAFEIFVRQHHIAALLVFVSFDNVVPRDRLSRLLVVRLNPTGFIERRSTS